MNVLTLIKNDHEQVTKLLSEIEKAIKDDSGERALDDFQKLSQVLMSHLESEESAVYSRLEEYESLKVFALEGSEDHGEIIDLLDRIDEHGRLDGEWRGLFIVLKETIERHFRDEEKDFFAGIKKALDTDILEEMGREMKAEQSSPQYEHSDHMHRPA